MNQKVHLDALPTEGRRMVSNSDLLTNMTLIFCTLIWTAEYLKRKCYGSHFRPNSAIQADKARLSHRQTAAILLFVLPHYLIPDLDLKALYTTTQNKDFFHEIYTKKFFSSKLMQDLKVGS